MCLSVSVSVCVCVCVCVSVCVFVRSFVNVVSSVWAWWVQVAYCMRYIVIWRICPCVFGSVNNHVTAYLKRSFACLFCIRMCVIHFYLCMFYGNGFVHNGGDCQCTSFVYACNQVCICHCLLGNLLSEKVITRQIDSVRKKEQ